MKTRLTILAAAAAAALAAAPASATGKMTCDAPKAQWKSIEALEAQLQKQGWTVRKSKVDGGCYEVYGTDPEGNRVEAYFHPVSFKKLLVSRRGEIIFRAP
ncbi:MAG TPA: PepSY domain-containing protein [Sphingomicrobium sp.]|nr:PepSY domain-containing protein [Sphingomicrobium sp.]